MYFYPNSDAPKDITFPLVYQLLNFWFVKSKIKRDRDLKKLKPALHKQSLRPIWSNQILHPCIHHSPSEIYFPAMGKNTCGQSPGEGHCITQLYRPLFPSLGTVFLGVGQSCGPAPFLPTLPPDSATVNIFTLSQLDHWWAFLFTQCTQPVITPPPLPHHLKGLLFYTSSSPHNWTHLSKCL